MFSDETATPHCKPEQLAVARKLGAEMRVAANLDQLAKKLADDPGYDFLADTSLFGETAERNALHLLDAATGFCANITPREADVWAPRNRPVTCHGKPVLRNGRKVWARYLLKPQRTSRKERALLEGDLTRFTAIDDLDRALNAGEITNAEHAHRLNELGSEKLTGVTTTHSRHVDVHHETADERPVLMVDKRSCGMLDAERATREEIRWLNGFYVTLLAEVEGWGEDPTHPIELSPAKPGARLKVGRHERHDPRVEQLTFENTIPNERLRPLIVTLLRRERVREADAYGHRPFREAPPVVKVNGEVLDVEAVKREYDAALHSERETRIERWLTSVGKRRNGRRFRQPTDAEGFATTVTTGPGIACSTKRITASTPSPAYDGRLHVNLMHAIAEAIDFEVAVWRYEGV